MKNDVLVYITLHKIAIQASMTLDSSSKLNKVLRRGIAYGMLDQNHWLFILFGALL